MALAFPGRTANSKGEGAYAACKLLGPWLPWSMRQAEAQEVRVEPDPPAVSFQGARGVPLLKGWSP